MDYLSTSSGLASGHYASMPSSAYPRTNPNNKHKKLAMELSVYIHLNVEVHYDNGELRR